LFWQMTSTAPWRRMILHFSHIGLTDGRTFMIPFGCSGLVRRLGSGGRDGRRYRVVDVLSGANDRAFEQGTR
jgi:hypothetical protein